MAHTDTEEFDSDGSNDSTISEGGLLNRERKHSPKFVSEPNLSVIDNRMDEETPKNTKTRGKRLFRSKVLSASQNINKKYQKRSMPSRSTPTCVSCVDDQNTESDLENSCPISNENESNFVNTPSVVKFPEKSNLVKINYLTSTPGLTEAIVIEDDICTTPYSMHFRRASMSPITKSTQKLSKAMQVCG